MWTNIIALVQGITLVKNVQKQHLEHNDQSKHSTLD
uniref:Uncharacterized protein n=1 Tax=Rhizophora mucronata TaxID=61149 RepID=A0A2P2PFS4_RHIMU